MSCETRRHLDSKTQSTAHHLEKGLESSAVTDLKWELGEIRRLAKDLLDALKELWEHEHEHGCNP